jgi:hypothetical protein
MGSTFFVYLRLGFSHIADLKGYDHILFVVALCALYTFRSWKDLLWLITAFTVGHSITLALATLNIVHFDTKLIEFLIPVTIFITSCLNILRPETSERNRFKWGKYGLALGFGLIHGLGFSNFLREILGKEESLALPLFAFNVGLEFGQLAIVSMALALTWLVVDRLKRRHHDWILVLSGATAGISLLMAFERMI